MQKFISMNIFILHADCVFYEYSKTMHCIIITRWILELNYNKLMYITNSGESIQRKQGMENYPKPITLKHETQQQYLNSMCLCFTCTCIYNHCIQGNICHFIFSPKSSTGEFQTSIGQNFAAFQLQWLGPFTSEISSNGTQNNIQSIHQRIQ